MSAQRGRDLTYGVGVHLARFGVIMLGLVLAPRLGITGWFEGLFVNVLRAGFAADLVTYLGLWNRIGPTTPWRGRTAALLLLVPLAEALFGLQHLSAFATADPAPCAGRLHDDPDVRRTR